jgi:rare lipoprotein A
MVNARPIHARLGALCMLLVLACGCATAGGAVATGRAATETGIASYYGREYHGRRTASGEVYDRNRLTAAHPRLPFGSHVRVTNLANGKSVVVTITDRGPFTGRRIIDLSYRAARELDFVREGTARVRVVALGD